LKLMLLQRASSSINRARR